MSKGRCRRLGRCWRGSGREGRHMSRGRLGLHGRRWRSGGGGIRTGFSSGNGRSGGGRGDSGCRPGTRSWCRCRHRGARGRYHQCQNEQRHGSQVSDQENAGRHAFLIGPFVTSRQFSNDPAESFHPSFNGPLVSGQRRDTPVTLRRPGLVVDFEAQGRCAGPCEWRLCGGRMRGNCIGDFGYPTEYAFETVEIRHGDGACPSATIGTGPRASFCECRTCQASAAAAVSLILLLPPVHRMAGIT